MNIIVITDDIGIFCIYYWWYRYILYIETLNGLEGYGV